ncbi:MFS transporter [Streptomyces sp. NPDC058157]|uniref:MFS transporter n=1 Tax=Streptomyces sp. NPDC058157 TaxID=3346360 RepID=UPI0036E3CCA8
MTPTSPTSPTTPTPAAPTFHSAPQPGPHPDPQPGPRPALYRLPDFRRFWAADTVVQAGTAVTALALPLVAIGPLGAGPFQTGLLVTCEYLGFLLLGLPAGAWVDRMRRRRVLVVGDLGKTLLLLTLPVAAWCGVLSLPQLYAVAFGLSVCAVFFDAAHQAHLPRLVHEEGLVAANVALESTRTVTAAAGPGAGGALLAVVTAPVALLVDAVAHLLSALLLARIRADDPRPAERPRGSRLRTEIAEGLRFLFRDPMLRGLTLTAAVSNLCGTVGTSMLLVLLAGELDLSPLLCGVVFTAEASGGFLGSLLAARAAARLGVRRAMCASVLVSGLLWLCAVPFFHADWRYAVACVLQGLGWTAFMTFRIESVALRQRVTPGPLLGRVSATFRFVVWGCMPVGALVGGLLAEQAGVRAALWVGAVGELCAVLPLLLGIRRARTADRSTRTPA